MLKVIKILYWIFNVVVITALLTIHFVLKERSYEDSINFYAVDATGRFDMSRSWEFAFIDTK